MATTIESGNAGAANKKQHLGIPEAIFVVSGNMSFSCPCCRQFPVKAVCLCLTAKAHRTSPYKATGVGCSRLEGAVGFR